MWYILKKKQFCNQSNKILRRALVLDPFPGTEECHQPWAWRGSDCFLEELQQWLPLAAQCRDYHPNNRHYDYCHVTHGRPTTDGRLRSGPWLVLASLARKYKMIRCITVRSTTKVRPCLLKKPFWYQISRVPGHQCGDGPGGWALECTAQAEAGCTGGPLHRGIHREDWSIPQSCIIAGEQVVSHLHGEVGNFFIVLSSVMFQIKFVPKSQWWDNCQKASLGTLGRWFLGPGDGWGCNGQGVL